MKEYWGEGSKGQKLAEYDLGGDAKLSFEESGFPCSLCR